MGTVFKLNLDGTGYTVLHNFGSIPNDGVFPIGVVQGSDGVLYGTASIGGIDGAGTVFKLNADGTGFTVLHDFGSPGDGRILQGAVVQGNDGALYGTTYSGGSSGQGIVFKLNTDGTSYTVLHNFGFTADNART